eukprot:284378-Pelagomonas_calceolata.AAC.1
MLSAFEIPKQVFLRKFEVQTAEGLEGSGCKENVPLVGSEDAPYINQGKGDSLVQRTLSLPRQRVRGKLVWVWWVPALCPQDMNRKVVTYHRWCGKPKRHALLFMSYHNCLRI